jgi:peptidoglycan/xylan/chitin deacetylase (PgdA/CDA1 family)
MALPLFAEVFNRFEIPVTFAIRGQLAEVNDSILQLLLKLPVEHDIGAHGYYHREFANLSRNEAEKELSLISEGMRKFDVAPKSFVFPKGSVAHLDLLEKYAYKCYRDYGDFMSDCMYVERKGQLYNIHPSLCLSEGASLVFLKKILDISIARRLPFHVWFHLWNFGETKKAIQKNMKKVFVPFFSYAKRKEGNGLLSFETMLSAAVKVEHNLGS